MNTTRLVLADENGLHNNTLEMGPFSIQTQTVGMNADLIVEKDGNGCQPNPALMDAIQDNIRDRFSLDNDNDEGPKGDSDEDDY